MDRILLSLLLFAFGLFTALGQEDVSGYDKLRQFALPLGFEGSTQWEHNTKEYQRLMQLRPLAVEFYEFYKNLTANELMLTGMRDANNNEDDLRCLEEVVELTNGVSNGSLWALRMIDSWGKLPSGILHGNFRDLGNFDECLRINELLTTSGQNLRGKYCFAQILTADQLGPAASLFARKGLNTAVCFPASCSGQQIDMLLRLLIQQLFEVEINATVQLAGKCQTGEGQSLDGLAIFTIVIISLLAASLAACTIYDYFICADQEHLSAWVKVFSARANSRVLFRIVDSSSNPNVIDCLHGIRCLSLIWVIYGHDYMMSLFSPNINMVDVLPWYRSAYSVFIMHALFSVDTFFFISGFLLVNVGLRSLERAKGKLNVPLMYLHRYLRLTPVLAMGILIYMFILPYLGNGPIHDGLASNSKRTCQDNWFWTLLYIQNYATTKVCLPHSWYLAVDMQLYVLSPILLIALYKWGKKGVIGIIVCMLLLAACLFSMMVVKGYTIAYLHPQIRKIYFTTHTRASPWLVGAIFGYYMHVNRGKSFDLKPRTVWLGWLLCLGLIFTCLFAVHPYAANGTHLPIVNEAFYVTLTRIAWPLALVWLVFACKYGYGGLANSFLSSPLWQPLSRLSYCAYIFHLFIESLHGANTHTNTYFSDYQMMMRFWTDFGFTILFAYFMYILVEAPLGGVEMLIFPNRRSSPEPPVLPPQPKSPIIEFGPEVHIIAPALQQKLNLSS